MDDDIKLLNRFTFDNFVVGSNSSLAHSICMAIPEDLGHAYNPLFLYSSVGLGKTHLVQSVAHATRSAHPHLKIIYCSCEKFTEDLILAIQNKKVDNFRQTYRSCDLLIIDDIHFIVGKERTQEEFFHTFNALFDRPSQIILTSDRAPKELEGIENRLISRFEWGILADIHPPDYEVRLAILQQKASSYDQEFDSQLLLALAECLSGSVRELEGCLLKLIALQTIRKEKLSIESLSDILSDIQTHPASVISLDIIIQACCSFYSVSISDLLSKRRQRHLAHARQTAMYLARILLNIPFREIGDQLGGRDHTTVLHAFNKIEANLKKDHSLQEELNRLKKEINQQALN